MCRIAQIDRGDSGWIRSPDGTLSLLGGHGPDRVLYLHTDYEGTPRVATDAAGHVVWRWNGNAFGTSRPTGGRIQPADNDAHSDHPGSRPIAVINLRYPGQYYDRETGFFYNGARYYDPETGRYVTSDPIGLVGGVNTYAYGGNNPLMFVDPAGLLSGAQWASLGIDFGTVGFGIVCPQCEASIFLFDVGLQTLDGYLSGTEYLNLERQHFLQINQATEGPVCRAPQ